MESALSLAHPEKADAPILVRLAGSVRLTRLEQFVNVLSLIAVILSERLMEVSAEQPASEAVPSSDTLGGRITAESFEQFSKADAPTICKELAAAKLSVERLVHPLKASGAICLMFEGMVTAVMAEQSLKAPARRTDTDGSSRIATATRLEAVTPWGTPTWAPTLRAVRLHPEKTFKPTDVRELGMMTSDTLPLEPRVAQFSNAESPRDLRLIGRAIAASCEQPLKADLPIDSRDEGRVICGTAEQFLNASSPMVFRKFGSLIEVSSTGMVSEEQSAIADAPIDVRDAGKPMVFSEEHPERAAVPRDVTLSGSLIDRSLEHPANV
jgi:hypothetical protein